MVESETHLGDTREPAIAFTVIPSVLVEMKPPLLPHVLSVTVHEIMCAVPPPAVTRTDAQLSDELPVMVWEFSRAT